MHMAFDSDIVKIVQDAIGELNEQLPAGQKLSCSPQTPLYEAGGTVDSLGLLNLIMAVERRVSDELGKAISLADENALSNSQSPFRTVGSLIAHVQSLVNK